MRRLIRFLFVLVFVSSYMWGKSKQDKLPTFERGKTVSFVVRLDQRPTVRGYLIIWAGVCGNDPKPKQIGCENPGEAQPKASGLLPYKPNDSEKEGELAIEITIPEFGPRDDYWKTWKVLNVFFQPIDSPSLDLKSHGDTRFNVVPSTSKLPKTAEVRIKF